MNTKKEFEKEFKRVAEKLEALEKGFDNEEQEKGYKRGLIVGRHSAFCEFAQLIRKEEE